jgi:hypothetical protein
MILPEVGCGDCISLKTDGLVGWISFSDNVRSSSQYNRSNRILSKVETYNLTMFISGS